MLSLGLQNISVRFGDVTALSNVSLGVTEGEVVMLVGPNGAGKSTLIGVLLGLVRPDAGRLVIDGRERVVDNAFKCELGYLPEAVAFAETLTGRQVLHFFASARGVPRRRVDEVLERVGLTAAAKRAVRGYSRGMRQRLGLGISILSVPKLLILDEPTGGLDQEGLAVLWSILSEWRDSGRLVLLASHELTLMERRIDRMCVLQHGKSIADDAPAKIREGASLPIAVHMTVRNGASERIQRALSSTASVLVSTADGELVASVPPADLKGVLALASADDGIDSMRVVESGLDDVYEYLLSGGG